MKSLQIKSGDLAIGPGGVQLVEGQARVVQDLSIASIEPFGCDRFHPGWGSVFANYIGLPSTAELEMLVRSEAVRIASNYMVEQARTLDEDAAAGRQPRLSSDEILNAITKVEVEQALDRLNVRVSLRTLSGNTVSLQSTVRS